MTATERTDDLGRLRALLHAPPADVADAVRQLAEERRRVSDGALGLELLDREQRWLQRFRTTGTRALQDELASVRREWLAARARRLTASPPDVGALLDLAEVRALASVAGDGDLVAACERGIDAGFAGLELDDDLGGEVAERFALLTSAIEDLDMELQVALLRSSGDVVRRLAEMSGSRRCRRLGRRLLRGADDRELARRLERRLGRRGVTALESTNFVLLLVVLVTLVIEATVPLTPSQLVVFHWIDALACLFFVADFAFELILHPSRLSWFWRNAATDLLPAVPSVLFLLPAASVHGAADNLLLLRLLRLLRVTWAARYVQALRPLLRSARLLLFLVRGLDGLAARFSRLLNREFVFLPAAADVQRAPHEEDLRDLTFHALQREHDLVELLPADARSALLAERVAAARAALKDVAGVAVAASPSAAGLRDVAVADAIEFLWTLRTQDVGRYLKPRDVQALDRVVRVLSTVPIRWLPLIGRLAVHPMPPNPEERIVALGRRVADWLESWHSRMLFVADLHGIVTGPQILDRVATAMVKASQRPAVRLLLFGGLFLVFNRLLHGTAVGELLNKIVGLPLVLLGSVCLVFLMLGHWMKRLAGQASENYRLTSEAHFISQLERVQSRHEQDDLDFLTRRVFQDPSNRTHARRLLADQLQSARTGVPADGGTAPDRVCLESNRVALLYLHFLDGAPLHISDVKTTEQLLANQSLENLRQEFLAMDRASKRELRRLKLDDGSLFSGPYLWFRFITESIAVEAAKRIAGYNSCCVPLDMREHADPAALQRMEDWLRRRRDPRAGRTPKGSDSDAAGYPTTEFTALDFLGGDEERDRHLAAVFGEDVLETVRFDRRTMIREIFGTRPVHHLPKEKRSFNPLRFYERRLSHGRVLLAPALLLCRLLKTAGWLVGRVRRVVREVLDPDLAMQQREVGEAPFAVALRKIHRMKAPGLLEAIRLRLRLDPVYSGAPPGWSEPMPSPDRSELERDLEFLQLREREAAELRDEAARVRREVARLHAQVRRGRVAWGDGAKDRERRVAGELAVTCAWIADKDGARSLMLAERWREDVLPSLLARREPVGWAQRSWAWARGCVFRHPVDHWLAREGSKLLAAARVELRAAYAGDHGDTRGVLDAWRSVPMSEAPHDVGERVFAEVYRNGPAVRRDLQALRAVQSLAVLDVRNYRDLVFRIGEFASEGEDPSLGAALP